MRTGAFLRGTLPHYLQVVNSDRLPKMPKFLINMYLPPARQNDIAVELARHIRQEFATRFRRSNTVEFAKRDRRKGVIPPALAS